MTSSLPGPVATAERIERPVDGAAPSSRRKFVVRAVCSAEEIDAAIGLLRAFAPRVTASDWRTVLVGPGREADGGREPKSVGFGAYHGGDMVGFLAAHASERIIRGRLERICNLHSVFVQPGFAPVGAYLLLAAMADPEVTLTALTPSPRVRDVLKAAHFDLLETASGLYPRLPDLHALRRGRPALQQVFGDETWLDPAHARLLRDHAPHGCRGHVVLVGDVARAFVITQRGRLRRLPMLGVSEILYLSDPAVAVRHFGWLKLAIMRAEGTMLLRCDARLTGGARRLAFWRARPGFFRSKRLQPIDIDNLYSEIIYLDVLAG